MRDLPDLMISYGIKLIQRGNRFECLCPAHDDHNPSMSVYRNGDGGWKAHCFACGFHEDAIGMVRYMENCDFARAQEIIGDPAYRKNGARYATIEAESLPPSPQRETCPPPEDAPDPPWENARYKTKDGEWVSLGQPANIWPYRTLDGRLWYYECRYEVIDSHGEIRKEPRCWSWGQRGAMPPRWECAAPDKPRPLYGLDRIEKARQILIVEGPKAAQAAQSLLPAAIAVITWPNGSRAVKNADWDILKDYTKDAILCPDADDAGREAMDWVANKLHSIGFTNISIIKTDDMPKGWDIADGVEDEWDQAKLIAFLKERKQKWEHAPEPEPVVKEYLTTAEPPSDPQPPLDAYIEIADEVFPFKPADLFEQWQVPALDFGLLPPVIAEFVADRAEQINTDPAYGALACVVTAAGMIDDRIRLQVHYDWHESARLWGCIVGEVSTKKTPMQNAVAAPLAKLVAKVAKDDAEIARRQEIKDKRYAAKMKEYTDAAIKSDDHGLALPPIEDREERLRVVAKNLTVEGLEEALRYCPRGIFVCVDELSGLIASMDAYKSAGSKKDRAQMLELFNGGALQKDLVGRGSFLIPNWSASILGGIQPSKIQDIAGTLTDDGFLQRFLIVCSNREGGIGSDLPPNKAAVQAWDELVDALYHIKHGGTHVVMSPAAAELRRESVAELYKIINTRMIGAPFIGHIGKWEGLTARMILTFHCIQCVAEHRHPESVEVHESTARLALDYMMKHLLQHSVSFYEDGLGQSDIHDAAKLIAGRIVAMGDTEVRTGALKQYAPNKYRQLGDEKQRQVLARLVEYGWLQPTNLSTALIKHPTRFIVNPAVHGLFAKHRDAEIARMEAAREIGDRIKRGVHGD